MSTTRVLLLVNPKSRLGAEAELDKGVEQLRQAGMLVEQLVSHSAEESREAVLQHRDMIDLVVVGGGDGTISSMAATLLDCKLPLGVLPLGTANDLARSLGVPARLDRAFDILVSNQRRHIDVAEANGRCFFNVAHMGLGVRVTRELDNEDKKRFGVLSYLHALVRAIARRDRFRVQMTLDGEKVRLRSMQLAVGNGRFYGGGNVVHEQAGIANGLLCLYSIRPQNVRELLWLAPLLRIGQQGVDRRVYCATGRDILIDTGSRVMEVHADGEPLTQTPTRFRIRPGALEVVAPAHFDDGGNH